jgi:AcrR family transcriptional regulator
MPYPSQINEERILTTVRQRIEAEGMEALSLHQLAAELGVKAPSLYRYFASKAALLRALNTQTNRELVAALSASIAHAPDDPRQRMLAVAQAYRAFAHAYPVTYGLAFTNTIPELRPDPQEQLELVLPLQDLMAQIVGADQSLAALRGMWALLHGFTMLELTGQFRRGGDLDAAFAAAIQAYLAGWER